MLFRCKNKNMKDIMLLYVPFCMYNVCKVMPNGAWWPAIGD